MGRQLPLHITQCSSSLWLQAAKPSNKPKHIFSPHKWAQGRLEHKTLDISQKCPICYFFNYEDHGWGYRIFQDRKELANMHISYELEFNAIVKIVQEKYPGEEDIIEFLCFSEEGKGMYKQVRQEITESKTYINSLENQFINCNVNAFKIFDISESVIDKLRTILTSEYLLKLESIFNLVEEFKESIGISEMEWMSFNYLVDKGV